MFYGRLDCVTSLTGFERDPENPMGYGALLRDITHTGARG